MNGWGGRIRTCACRDQNPVPYRLATPQELLEHFFFCVARSYLLFHRRKVYTSMRSERIKCLVGPQELLEHFFFCVARSYLLFHRRKVYTSMRSERIKCLVGRSNFTLLQLQRHIFQARYCPDSTAKCQTPLQLKAQGGHCFSAFVIISAVSG